VPTYLDLGAIGIVLVTALLSMMWGLKRSVLAIGSFATAQAATGYLYPYVFLFLNPYFSENSLANVASLAAVFFVVLIALLLLTVRIYAFLDPKIGALDRSLGLVFGAAFSFLYVVAAFFMFSFLVGERHQPEWVRNAKTRVVLIETADRIIAMLPASDAATTIEGWISSKTSPSPTPSKATTRSEIDKQKLDSIINKLPGAAPNKP
jgi:membrane protein required for colicin V production